MRAFLSIIFIFSISAGFGQVTKMVQIKNQVFQMNGIQHDESVEKKTKIFGVTVNYETGELNGVVNLVELDLLNKNKQSSPDPEEDVLKIRGFLPLNDILYNQQDQRTYTVELQLIIKEFTVPVLFNFNIGYVRNTQVRFHDVRAMANVNLLDFNVEDLNGFEPNVNILLMFQMLNLQR